MTTHTPGPWESDESLRSIKVKGRWESIPTWTIWPCDLDNGVRWIAQHIDSTADARLIAAAPDLLAALKTIVGSAKRGFPGNEAALAAIAKAEGKTWTEGDAHKQEGSQAEFDRYIAGDR